jgi:hypothetical protein
VANLGNKILILQVLNLNFLSFGVETGNIDLRQLTLKTLKRLATFALI